MDTDCGEEGEGGMNGESSVETYTTTIYKRDDQWEFAI